MAPGLGWRRPKAIASTALASAWSARSPIAQPTICLAFAAQGLPQTFRAVGFAGLDMQLLDPLQQTGIQAYFTAAPTQSTPPHFLISFSSFRRAFGRLSTASSSPLAFGRPLPANAWSPFSSASCAHL